MWFLTVFMSLLQDERKTDVLNEIKLLRQRIDERNWGDAVQDMIRMLKLVKDLERKESDLLSSCKLTHADVEESFSYGGQLGIAEFDQALSQSMEKLTSAKRECAAKLRAILSVKRKIGDVPTQVELIQYVSLFCRLVRVTTGAGDPRATACGRTAGEGDDELYSQIQLQDALTSSIGCSKLVDSMEVIVKGAQQVASGWILIITVRYRPCITQYKVKFGPHFSLYRIDTYHSSYTVKHFFLFFFQKLEKVQLSLLAEKKHSDSLREKHTAAIADQRHFSSLLKAFQVSTTFSNNLANSFWYVVPPPSAAFLYPRLANRHNSMFLTIKIS
ncbi:hypothetical protein GW17_00017215 [Ensete ventricosum]|nr:hypothetical protein GW17_00017215 [Ensete ventricosum]